MGNRHWVSTTNLPNGMNIIPNVTPLNIGCENQLWKIRVCLFGASRGSVNGLAVFRAGRGPRPSADGPGPPRIIHLMQNHLPCIAKTAS